MDISMDIYIQGKIGYYVTVIMVQIENRTKRNLPMRNASYL